MPPLHRVQCCPNSSARNSHIWHAAGVMSSVAHLQPKATSWPWIRPLMQENGAMQRRLKFPTPDAVMPAGHDATQAPSSRSGETRRRRCRTMVPWRKHQSATSTRFCRFRSSCTAHAERWDPEVLREGGRSLARRGGYTCSVPADAADIAVDISDAVMAAVLLASAVLVRH